MSHEQFDNLLNFMLLGVAIFTIVVSWIFSNIFFGITTGFEYVGFLLIIAITVLEWVYVRDGNKLDPWMIAAAIAAYIYDIVSNIGGFLVAFNAPFWVYIASHNWNTLIAKLPVIVVMIVLGWFMAVLPERMLRHSITKVDVGGMFGKLLAVRNYSGRTSTNKKAGFAPPQRTRRPSLPKPRFGKPSMPKPITSMTSSIPGLSKSTIEDYRKTLAQKEDE